MSHRSRRNAGFTLIELMVVIVILGLLVTITAPMFTKILEDAKVDTTKAQMKAIDDAVKIYKLKKNKYPDQLQDLISEGYLPGPDLPLDGWDTEFVYEKKGKTYDIISYGADKEPGEGEDEHDHDIHLEDLRRKKAE